ncbi:2-C-methyl-D-erythritol 4-phosphate cytidylyltransferase [Vibrio sp. S9_S30]|uniref:2-C-methyl-D-erythritol 4-phosphate cytidylyltransferase n=1 Tax=Vibrio sp. S9_S30 TaxID=2720226 RepID=UPI00168196E8|nr:2-C-methyl-D-erythritol 4-phosphate cytidylyltransferase [Vibrio sp. S9_S30]MBD1555357.1 2-C-methyl-D-erythritol 4-phosphate cytidylyltransferase [Vibrio sp. S9_S30]
MTTTDSHADGVIAIVPAAGVGRRMQANCPKQYLTIGDQTILEHTVRLLLSHPQIDHIVIAVSEGDEYFSELAIADHPKITRVVGGVERADSVLSGLNHIHTHFEHIEWVLVHDAARPCITLEDIDKLILACKEHAVGGILAVPVKDTMKRSDSSQQIQSTVERENLWHALTPQMFRCKRLKEVLKDALEEGVLITDEASAMERCGYLPLLVSGRADNIKITQPEDLALAEFYLSRND